MPYVPSQSLWHDIFRYTLLARQMLGIEPLPSGMTQPIDIFGQGTWRVTEDRGSWALWSDEVVSEEVSPPDVVGLLYHYLIH